MLDSSRMSIFTWALFSDAPIFLFHSHHLNLLSRSSPCFVISLCALIFVNRRLAVYHLNMLLFSLWLGKWVVLRFMVCGVIHNSSMSVTTWHTHLSYICIYLYKIKIQNCELFLCPLILENINTWGSNVTPSRPHYLSLTLIAPQILSITYWLLIHSHKYEDSWTVVRWN